MKNLLCLLICFCVFSHAFAQRLDPATISKLPARQQEEVNAYLQQARNARSAALGFTIGGGALLVGGLAMVISSVDLYDYTGTTTNDNQARANAGGVLMLAGTGAALASIPFWIKIHKKRNAARAIIYDYRKASPSASLLLPQKGTAVGFGLTIPLGR